MARSGDGGDDEEPGPGVSYNLEAVLQLRDRLIDEAAFGYDYLKGEGRVLWSLLDAVHAVLGPRGVEKATILDSLVDVRGQELTPRLLARAFWRLAGNLKVLRAGRAVGPWAAQHEPEWMPMQVTLAHRARNHKDELGCWYTFRVLAGSACPLEVRRFWSNKACRYFASRMGFTGSGPRVKKPMPFEDPRQLVGLRLYGLFVTDHRPGRPWFERIYATESLLRHNRSILELRYRHRPCPRGFSWPCHGCSLGYKGEDSCEAACHPTQWYAGDCPDCGGEGVAFEEELSTERCLACERRRRSAHRD